MEHLTIRVAWHDNRWNGAVCLAPSRNAYCIELKRIRANRNDQTQDLLAGRDWADLNPSQLPPCVAESGGFMNARAWRRRFKHPYADNPNTKSTHGALQETDLIVPEYSALAVPFAWMLRENQTALDERTPYPLPLDEDPPFPTPWVFGAERQEAIANQMFGRITEGKSLALFYCKEGQPLGDTINRLVVGLGTVTKVGQLKRYESATNRTYPFWDRVISHSIRPDGVEGFLLPYHDYLADTGDADENERRIGLLREIAVAVQGGDVRAFSYAAELANSDVALSVLLRTLEAVRLVRSHAISSGPWIQREEWVNSQISSAWTDRGAFPGIGSSLEALGMRLGTSLVLEMRNAGQITSSDDPWDAVDAVLRGTAAPPTSAYLGDIAAVRPTWMSLPDDRRQLLRLLSRFALSPSQAGRWYDSAQREKCTNTRVSDIEILSNPYRIVEADLGGAEDLPVPIDVVDRGLLPTEAVLARHPVEQPATIESTQDLRRLRAALATVLRAAAENGDSLLSAGEAIEALSALELARPIGAGEDWLRANAEHLSGTVEIVPILPEDAGGRELMALQLSELKNRGDLLGKIIKARAARQLPLVQADWTKLLREAITKAGGTLEASNARHSSALNEQAQALEIVTSRKLSVLVGRAGTGKTTVLGALTLQEDLRKQGILLLAPTGKARVRLGRAAGLEASTIAQFLNSIARYDGARQRPLFHGKEKYRKEKTIIIDESSMLTEDDLSAVLNSLDLAHVDRLILVGDPNQLPPIGVGRPFADIVGFLERADESGNGALAGAVGKLTVEMRTFAGGPSTALKLANWFTREPQPVDADWVLNEIATNSDLGDLDLAFWSTPEELHARILEQFQKHLGLTSADDVRGFNSALGFDERNFIPFDKPDGAENFQLLSPVRLRPFGVFDLNRWIQQQFRQKELSMARRYGNVLGTEEIVVKDKVIQVKNERRYGYDGRQSAPQYLANGEVGIVARHKAPYFNVAFAGRPNWTFGYKPSHFSESSAPLELAYALTIHKAQGSEFQSVFVILPKASALLSRELLYTALTRSRRRLVLLVEGESPAFLYELTQRSETARRNTNLFHGAVREQREDIPFAQHLIHRTDRGELVRSKSELVIANMLYSLELDYQYERVVTGIAQSDRVRPDFAFTDPAGDLIIWEHLGMLTKPDYKAGWERKKIWYQQNGYIENSNLFTTEDDDRGGLDSTNVRRVAELIKAKV